MMERFLQAIIPKFWKCKQENNYFPSATPEDPADSRSLRELSLKENAEDEALEKFLVNPASEREEALELREALYGLYRDKLSDSDTDLQGDGLSLEDIVIFLKEFPDRKMKLEERIQGLHAVADQIEKTHKKCAITNVVAGSTSIVSGVMTILGLALAPVTVGGSLILSASGIGLGALATVTSLSSNVIEHASNLAARERVSNHEGTKARVAVEVLCKEAPHLLSAAQKCVTVGNQVMEEINKNIRAFRLAKANPRLTANAKKFMGAGYLSTWRSQKVEKAFSGTALAMTKGSRVMSAMTAGALVLVDMITFMHDLSHLLKGAEAEMAGELREQAQELENKLKELSQAYNNLLDIITTHSQGEGEAGDDTAGSAQ
ncbi:apolipoprotein L6 [Sarcophilus harrisii]|uniref:Apolipoprotein L6 n=1 Tax=Sarcophilus harrisii TaxID=9305 RepID=G3VVX5_SARHA|nr:apolipoprotein L6 [Sarcophilus harrisii]XP_031794166.1 apolipoprotein L6 [Sarcophilus harrisii]